MQSLSNQTTFLSSFLESAKTESVDLGKATTELKKFKTLDFMSNYTMFDFVMDMPLGMSNAVTGAYLSLAVILFLVSFLCCCTCKCFRNAIFKLLGALWDILYEVIRSLCCCIWNLIMWSESTDSQATAGSGDRTELSSLPDSGVSANIREKGRKGS
jgi:hypothetical protein